MLNLRLCCCACRFRVRATAQVQRSREWALFRSPHIPILIPVLWYSLYHAPCPSHAARWGLVWTTGNGKHYVSNLQPWGKMNQRRHNSVLSRRCSSIYIMLVRFSEHKECKKCRPLGVFNNRSFLQLCLIKHHLTGLGYCGSLAEP